MTVFYIILQTGAKNAGGSIAGCSIRVATAATGRCRCHLWTARIAGRACAGSRTKMSKTAADVGVFRCKRILPISKKCYT